MAADMTPLFDTIIEQVPPPAVDIDGPLQMQISALDYSAMSASSGSGASRAGGWRRIRRWR
jgi:GTP-binding protein